MKKINQVLAVGIFTALFFPVTILSQVTFYNGENILELSGTIATYYNARFLNASNPNNHVGNVITGPMDQKHNNFGLGTARLNLAGMYGRKYEYRLEFDMDALGFTPSSTTPANYSALLNAYAMYKAGRGFSIKAGYMKLPYSANNMAYYPQQPYWHRAQIVSGDIFSRRDICVTLKQSLYNEHINIYACIATGMGEYAVTTATGGDQDGNGKPEFVGRIDFSTKKYNFNEIYDSKNTRVPLLNLGFNGRYVERTTSISGLADYDLKIIGGKKKTMGLDAAFAWRGISAQFEIHQLIINPINADTLRLQSKATNYFRAGGLFGQLNYYNKKLKSGVYVRYDNFIPNDLIKNNMEQTVSFGFSYFIKGFKSMIRTQYTYRVDKFNTNLLKTNDEVRIGWQFMF